MLVGDENYFYIVNFKKINMFQKRFKQLYSTITKTCLLKCLVFSLYFVLLTAVMFDLCAIFKTLQKLFQKSNLILPDVLTAKDSAMENLKIMKDIPVPGGKEELNLQLQEEDNEQGRPVRRTSTAHQFVTSRNRDSNAIRNEIVQSSINFLGQRMNTENDGTIECLMSILDATSSKDLVLASRNLVSLIFGSSCLSDFVSDVCKS